MILRRMSYLADTMKGDFLFGSAPSVADFYLFVMLLWAKKFDLQVPGPLTSFRDRLMERESVKKAMQHEELI